MSTVQTRPMAESPAPTPITPLWKKHLVRRLLLVALCAEIGYAVLNISTMPVFLVETRHLGEASVGLVLTAFLLSEAALKGPMGHLADKYGRKRLMTVGPLFTIFTPLLTFLVPWHPAWL